MTVLVYCFSRYLIRQWLKWTENYQLVPLRTINRFVNNVFLLTYNNRTKRKDATCVDKHAKSRFHEYVFIIKY